MFWKNSSASSTVRSSDIGNGLASELDFERFPVVAPAFAFFAGHIDVGQELHLDADDAVALAGFTASALDVEAEATRLVATSFGFGQAGIEFTNVREDADIGGRIAARRPADGTLVDIDHLVQEFDAFDRVDVCRADPWRGTSSAPVFL